MANAVLISIRPEWVEKILAGEKALEVRKNRPNMGTPFKCYIYCTNSGVAMEMRGKHGKVVGEFVCDKITWLTHIGFTGLPGIRLAAIKNGNTIDDSFDFSKSCLTTPQIEKYLGGKDGYAWHISDFKVYENPKKFGDFTWPRTTRNRMKLYMLERPPQSWCYVEELK